MRENSPLPLLIELAQNERDAILRQIVTAQCLLADNEAQLKSLQTYHSEYLSRLSRNSHNKASQLRNFHEFLSKLEIAITQQAGAVEQHRQRVKALEPELTQVNIKIKSYEVLHEKRLQASTQQAQRQERKLEDEHAARVARTPLVFGTR